MNIVYN